MSDSVKELLEAMPAKFDPSAWGDSDAVIGFDGIKIQVNPSNIFEIQDLFERVAVNIHQVQAMQEAIEQLQPSVGVYSILSQSGYLEWLAFQRTVENADRYGFRENGYSWCNSAAGFLKFLIDLLKQEKFEDSLS